MNAITNGLELEDAYGETLSRIMGQGKEEWMFGIAASMWISHSERPLKVDGTVSCSRSRNCSSGSRLQQSSCN